jgi:hypothetical protein
MLWVYNGPEERTVDLLELPRQLDAIDYAAERLGYNVREVKERTEKIRHQMMVTPFAPDVRRYMINMRGWDMPPQFATSGFMDLHLERLIDQLSSDEERAATLALARKLAATYGK